MRGIIIALAVSESTRYGAKSGALSKVFLFVYDISRVDCRFEIILCEWNGKVNNKMRIV